MVLDNAHAHLRRALIAKLPPFPQVALQLVEQLISDDFQMRAVVRTIQSDTAFAAELLQIANSPLFGHVQEVKSVQQAVVLLGWARLRALTMTVALRAYLNSAISRDAFERCWRHSLATALLAEILAGDASVMPEVAYTAGLLHDLGRLSLMAGFPGEASQMLRETKETSAEMCIRERKKFGVDHAELGGWLMEEWKFPSAFAESAARHHDNFGPEESRLAALVRTSCRLATHLDFAAVRFSDVWDIADICRWLPDVADALVEPRFDQLRDSLTERMESLSRLCPAA